MRVPSPLPSRHRQASAHVSGVLESRAVSPTASQRWDPLLVAIGAYIAVNIGRIHQLIPVLEKLKPGVLTGVVMLTLFFTSRSPSKVWARLDRRWRFCIVGLAVWAMLTIPLSLYAGMSFKWWKDVILQSTGLALVVAMSIRGIEDAKRLAAVFVMATAFYSIMILRNFGADLDVRFEGLYSYDTNDFAQVVVCAIPLAIYLALAHKRLLIRGFYWMTVGLFLLIVIKSGSRGGFLGLVGVGGTALLAWRAVQPKWRVAALLGAVVFLGAFGRGMFLSRVASIGSAGSDYNVTEDTGRIQAWKRGLRYMLQNPVLGVGAGAFGVAEGTISDLAVEAKAQGRLNVKWMAPHNSFVEIGAETGVPGLLLFLGLAVVLLRRSGGLANAPSSLAQRDLALFGGSLLLSVIGFYVTAFFLSQAYSAILYLLAGLVGGLLRVDGTPTRQP